MEFYNNIRIIDCYNFKLNIFGITNDNGNNKKLIIDNFINFLKTQNEINITEFHEIIMNVNINENFKSNKENENFSEEKSISEFL